MSAFDLSQLLWPDASQRRQPQHPVKLRDRFGGGVAYIAGDRVGITHTLSQTQSANPGIALGEREIIPSPATGVPTILGSSAGSHVLVFRLRAASLYWWYYINIGDLSLAFTPHHSNYSNEAIIYDGSFRRSGFVFTWDRFTTLVVRFTPGETSFFADGLKYNSQGRTEISGIWQYREQNLEGTTPPRQSLLGWFPGVFYDAECLRISEEPYSALFEHAVNVGFDYPSGGGPITLNSLDVVPGSTTARFTVSVTR